MARRAIRVPKIRRRKVNRPPPGSAPGTLAPSEVRSEPAALFLYRYDPTSYQHRAVSLQELEPELANAPTDSGVLWIDVQGVGDLPTVERIGELLGLHPLTVEDLVHTHQRPKLEAFDTHLFVTLRAVRLLGDGTVDNEQISLIWKRGLLVTFQEREGDGFDGVRRRLEGGRGRLRSRGADYLASQLMDAAIDNYFPVLEDYGAAMDQLDDAIRAEPSPDLSNGIHSMRRELRALRRAVWPLRDVISGLARGDLPEIASTTLPSFRDCYDHVVQVGDFVEGARERASDLADLHLVMLNERTNQVMKVLTVMSSIFIPLSFLVGLYGMNFNRDVSPYNMPELDWRFGYPVLLLLMGALIAGMLLFFRRKGWIGRQ